MILRANMSLKLAILPLVGQINGGLLVGEGLG